MHDLTLGGPVTLDTYYGPLFRGKPLHTGPCSDGVNGCAKCNSKLGCLYDDPDLTAQEREELELDRTSYCDWCKKEHPEHTMREVRAWDEPVLYVLCSECQSKNVPDDDEFDDWDDDDDGWDR